MIELITTEELDIKLLCFQMSATLEKVQELLDIYLPSGDTLFHYLVQSNCDKLQMILMYGQYKHMNLKIVPNLEGITALHICVRDS